MAEAKLDQDTAAQVNNETAVAIPGTVAHRVNDILSANLGDVGGDVGMADIRLPRLNIVYGVGELAAVFTAGDLVLGGDILLAHRGEPVYLIVLSAATFWREYLTPELRTTGLRPREFLTESEAQKAGGTTEWINGVGPTFSKAMTMRLLVQKPDNVEGGPFGVDLGDKVYAPALWTVDKTAYQRVGPAITSARNFALRKTGLISGMFELKTAMEKSKRGNVVPMPTIRYFAPVSTDAQAAIRALFGIEAAAPKELRASNA